MEMFFTKNGMGEWNCSSTKNNKKGSERDDRSLTKKRTEQDRTKQKWKNWKKRNRVQPLKLV